MNRTHLGTSMMLAAALLVGLAHGQSTGIISVTPGGTSSNGFSYSGQLTPDGRFVVFISTASDLVPGDTNALLDVYLYDRVSTTMERVSVGAGGVEPNSFCTGGAASADGRFVTFGSMATNLVAGDTNQDHDVFVRDRLLGTTECVSLDTSGQPGTGDPSYPLVNISADGRFVVFDSTAPDLVPGDTNQIRDMFVRDRLSGTTERVSVATGGIQASGSNGASRGALSADGRFVLFLSDSPDLVPGDTNQFTDVFVHDRQSGTTERVSVSTTGAEMHSFCLSGPISADGRFAFFASSDSTLAPGDTGFDLDVFVRDRQAGTTALVSLTANGTEANGDSGGNLSISPDGRFVAFRSDASNLVPGDTNLVYDVFVRDRQAGTTQRVSLTAAGGQGAGEGPSISSDGRFVTFHTAHPGIVSGDTNGASDVFLRDRGAPTTPSAFCSGDGSGTSCPCGNAGVAGQGCASSVSPSGALLSWSGVASLGTDTLVLAGSGMPNEAAIYFQGISQQAGGAGVVFGDGLRCTSGTTLRFGTLTNVGGSSHYPNAGQPSVSIRGRVMTPGNRTYQIWYRNAAAFCTGATYNLSNGLQVAWVP